MIKLTSMNTTCGSSKWSQKNKWLPKKGAARSLGFSLNLPLVLGIENTVKWSDILVTLLFVFLSLSSDQLLLLSFYKF